MTFSTQFTPEALGEQSAAYLVAARKHLVRMRVAHPVVLYPGSANDVALALSLSWLLFERVERVTVYLIDPEAQITAIKKRCEEFMGCALVQEGVTLSCPCLTVHVLPVDVFALPDDLMPEHITLYVERAFSLWRNKHPDFTTRILRTTCGFVVSDTPMLDVPAVASVPLGFYGPLGVWRHPVP